MSKRNRGYHIHITTNTITVTKSFEARMNEPGSAEYDTYVQLQKDFPHMRFVFKASKNSRKTNAKGTISYDKMKNYIECLDESETYLAQFETVKKLARSHRGCISFARKWFFAVFPDFFELPKFNANGKLIVRIDGAAGHEVVKEMEAKVA